MHEITCTVGEEVVVLSDASCRRLAHLSDADLLHATRRLTAASNQLLAALLEHLAEVEARGVHRAKACASLYTYCVYELRFSEDAAYRRVAAARLVQRFPALFDAVARGELTLTGLLQIGPHLNDENLLQVLARAKHRTKKELAKLVRELSPLPDAPACIEPLGPAKCLDSNFTISSHSLCCGSTRWRASRCAAARITRSRQKKTLVDTRSRANATVRDTKRLRGNAGTDKESALPAPARILRCRGRARASALSRCTFFSDDSRL